MMRIKASYNIALFLSAVSFLCACTDNDFSGFLGSRTYPMSFNVCLDGFDNSTTRTTESEFADGDQIYILFRDGEKTVNGTATYSLQSRQWTLTASQPLAETAESSCQVAFVDGHQGATAASVTLDEHSCVYRDSMAVYQLSDGMLTVQGRLAPVTGRIRFKGSDGQKGVFRGLSVPLSFSLATHTLTKKASPVSVTCGSDGYTPYCYVSFSDETARQLIYELDSRTGLLRTFGHDVLQPKSSGHVAIPTAEHGPEWTLVNLDSEDVEVWDGTVATSFESGTGTKADPYVIATPAQLAYIGSSGKSDAYFKLKKNLDLNNVAWKPIPDFNGHLDGNGKTIYRLRVGRSQDQAGLFSVLGKKSEVKSLTLSGVRIELSENKEIGALAGVCRGDVADCHVVLDAASGIAGVSSVGGLVGAFRIEQYNEESHTFKSCTVSAPDGVTAIRGTYMVGGLIGEMYGYDYNDQNIVTDCHVEASVGGNSGIGGLIGYAYSYMSFCSVTQSSFTGQLTGEQSVGGIFGNVSMYISNSGRIVIKNCRTQPTVSCGEKGGGLIGLANSGRYDIQSCYAIVTFDETGTTNGGLIGYGKNLQQKEANVNCCYSVVRGTTDVKGLVGSNETGSYLNCYDCFTTAAATAVTGAYLKTENCKASCVGDGIVDNLRDSGSAYLQNWNFSNTFTTTATTENGQKEVVCPRLSWE